MPGILPMKLIKCGNSQTRIAQACDRCRSKKIRCDGIRPCCSQCANVGFECKTSDKLSRRAFPRGYTESLEERVRQLEAEVRQLKELLDAKDEQLDMVSRIHSFSPYSPPPSGTSGGPQRVTTTRQSPVMNTPSSSGAHDDHDDGFTMQEPAFLVKDGNGSFYLGGSSGLPFVDYFKKKLQDSGRLKHEFDVGAFFTQPSNTIQMQLPMKHLDRTPSRLSSDQYVTSFFQEYHPLFPMLHRPTFLKQYEKFISLSETLASSRTVLTSHSLTQMYLVFAISARHSESRSTGELQSLDMQWRQALNEVLFDTSLETVQCLLLAQLYCFALGDFQRLEQYKSLCVGMVLRMGLNRTQSAFSQNALISELRKRAFWAAYCLDSFSAAALGLPRLLKDEDISAEYPSDIDDQYITQDGFLSTLPGDFTKISAAIALFRCSRVLANVLDSVYPITLAHEQTYRRLKELEDELDTWKAELAPHLRLEFVNGVPATNVVHSRSPLLVLAYHYIRVLIHRPVVRSNEAAAKTSPSFLAMAESSKHIVQIVQLFSERKLGFTFCLNKNYLLLLSGFAILYGAVNYQQKGSLAKESEKLISGVLHELEKAGYEKVNEFRSIAQTIVEIEPLITQDLGTVSTKQANQQSAVRMESPISPLGSPNQEGQSLRRRVSSISAKFHQHRKDLTSSTFGSLRRTNSHTIESTPYPTQPPMSRRNTLIGPMDISTGRIQTTHGRHSSASLASPINTDYLNWAYETSAQIAAQNAQKQRKGVKNLAPTSTDEWIKLIAVMDASQGAHIYGGLDTAASSAPTITGLNLDSWGGLDGYFPTSSSQSVHNEHYVPKIQPYSTTPPSVSSFSTLSDEGFSSEDNMGKNVNMNSPATGADMSDLANVDGGLFGEEELRGLMAAQAGFLGDGVKDLDVWAL